MGQKKQLHNAQPSETDRRSDVTAIATPGMPLTAETQPYDPLRFASAPAKYSGSDFLGNTEAHGKYTLDFQQ